MIFFRIFTVYTLDGLAHGYAPRQVRAKDEKEKRYLTGSIQVRAPRCRNRCVHYAELS